MMSFADLFFDTSCKICHQKMRSGTLCENCKQKIEKAQVFGKRTFYVGTRRVDGIFLLNYNDKTVKKLIFALKRSADRELVEYAASLYQKGVNKESGRVNVTYVPRKHASVGFYGYDHVKKPCRVMCKKSGGRMNFLKLLSRKGFSKEQKTLSAEMRHENVLGIFKVKSGKIPESIILFDDVVTTGSTLCACAEAIFEKRSDVNLSFVCLASSADFSGKG